MSDFGRLWSYGHFLIPVHAIVWNAFTEPAGGIMNSASLVASSRYLDTWEECREGGLVCSSGRAVHNRAAACVAAGGGIFENQLKAQINSN